MRTRRCVMVGGAAAGLMLLGLGAAGAAQSGGAKGLLGEPVREGAKAPAPAPAGGGAGRVHEIQTVVMRDGGHEVKVVRENDDLDVYLDGRKAPRQLIMEFDRGLKVLNGDGEVVATVFTAGGGVDVRPGDAEGSPRLVVQQLGAAEAPPAPPAPPEPVRGRWRADVEPAPERPRVMLGVTMSDLTEPLARRFGLEPGRAILLSKVAPDLPAGRAGLLADDVIVEIEGDRPATRELLTKVLRQRRPGQTVELEVVRRGEALEIVVELERYDRERLNEAFGDSTSDAIRRFDFDFGREQELAELRNKMARMSARAAELAAEQARAQGVEARELAEEMAMVSRSMAELAERLAVESAKPPAPAPNWFELQGGGGAGGRGLGGVVRINPGNGAPFFVRPWGEDEAEEFEHAMDSLREALEDSFESEDFARIIREALEDRAEAFGGLGDRHHELLERLEVEADVRLESLFEQLGGIEERLEDSMRWRHELAPRLEEHSHHAMERLEQIERRVEEIEERLDERFDRLEEKLERLLERRRGGGRGGV